MTTTLQSEHDRLVAKISALEAALKPFANLASSYDKRTFPNGTKVRPPIDVEKLRGAAALMEPVKPASSIDISKFGFKSGANQRYCGTCGTEFRGSVDATTCDSCACVLAHQAGDGC